MSYLAYTYTPDKLLQWVRRNEGSKGHYVAQFEQVYDMTLDQAWQDWIAFEKTFQEKTWQRCASTRPQDYKDVSDRGLGSVSRAHYDPATGKLFLALRYPGVVAHIAEMSMSDGTTENIADIKGPMLYKVTSLARNPDTDALFYTTDNYAYRDLMTLDRPPASLACCWKMRVLASLVFNKADQSLWGVRHLNGIATLVRIPHPYTRWNQVHSFEYGEVLYDLDISPDGKLLSLSFGEVNGDQSLRIYRSEQLLEGTVTPVDQFDFRPRRAGGFRVLAGRRVPVRQFLLHRHLEYFSVRTGDQGTGSRQ